MIGSKWKNKHTSRTATLIEEENVDGFGIVYTLAYSDILVKQEDLPKLFRVGSRWINWYWTRIDGESDSE